MAKSSDRYWIIKGKHADQDFHGNISFTYFRRMLKIFHYKLGIVETNLPETKIMLMLVMKTSSWFYGRGGGDAGR